jgi:hypothetical protein
MRLFHRKFRPDYTHSKIHELLAERHEIAIIWDTDDVLSVREDLSPIHAWHVLEHCRKCHDAEVGINWDVLEAAAECLFPED